MPQRSSTNTKTRTPHSNPSIPTLPPSLTTPTSPARTHLLTSLRLLHLLHARNRNQHRRSLWYRQFSYFRREIGKFCADIGITIHGDALMKGEGPAENKKGGAVLGKRKRGGKEDGSVKKETFTGVQAAKACDRLTYWVSADLIPKWYTALTTLTKTPSFSSLSLTLLSLFSRLLHLTTALSLFTAHAAAMRASDLALQAQERKRKDMEDEDEVVRVLEVFQKEMQREEEKEMEEVGVRVERGVGGVREDGREKAVRIPSEPRVEPKPKRKKKPAPKNAIDALFAGL